VVTWSLHWKASHIEQTVCILEHACIDLNSVDLNNHVKIYPPTRQWFRSLPFLSSFPVSLVVSLLQNGSAGAVDESRWDLSASRNKLQRNICLGTVSKTSIQHSYSSLSENTFPKKNHLYFLLSFLFISLRKHVSQKKLFTLPPTKRSWQYVSMFSLLRSHESLTWLESCWGSDWMVQKDIVNSKTNPNFVA
jgi:hypothetical protein